MNKPDFLSIATEIVENWNFNIEDDTESIKLAMEHVWTSHVEPLMKELDGILCVNCGKPKSGHYHDVVSSRFACYAGTEKCSILTFEVPTFERARDDRQRFVNEHEKLQSRIRELEEDRDKFAIGFARHMIYSAWEYDYREQRSHTVEEQLAIYKESLLNHKP